ncbi:hypothetical protein [Streptomyces sp. AC627_RSS907]|uniref:hypothetical protein n=1 Tax=Streptomyces sp. AC627_RSS907 TaxID=2823684 RepID=UPI001C24ABDB|nr:hypothetical protein [Streptomyces sp. AC627_RSS907]
MSAPAHPAAVPTQTSPVTPYRTLHLLLTAVSLTLVLLSVNRRTELTLSFVAPNEFLRWTDLNNMVLGMVTVLLYYAIITHLTGAGPGRFTRFTPHGPVFALAAYLYACSYGMHEITNYLNSRFCLNGSGAACRIIDFNDSEFSHYLFFGGFILLNASIVLAQLHVPAMAPLTRMDNVLLVLNAAFVAAGIAANLAFEQIGIDLYVVAAVALGTLTAAHRLPGQPILRYYNVGYIGGLVLTAAIRTAS